MLRIAYFISILFFLLSCTSQSTVSINNGYVDFPEVWELKAKTIQLDTALFRYPFRVHAWDNKAVVLDLHGTDHYFHAFSYPEFHYLSSLVRGEMPPKKCFRQKTSDGVKNACGHWMQISRN